MKNLVWMAVCIVMCMSVYLLMRPGYGKMEAGSAVSEELHRDTVIDTVVCYVPRLKDSVVVRYEECFLPKQEKAGTAPEHKDSVTVVVPIEQKIYSDSNYTAYVSGYRAKMDSIIFYPRTERIYMKEFKPPNKWHIGLSAGYAVTPEGLRPYVGIGISYSIFSF